MSDIDVVAEAICAAMNPQNTPNEIRERMQHDSSGYRRMAQAAIDALQLTQHWAVTADLRDGQVYSVISRSESITRELAEERRPYGAPDDEVISRWVTPWAVTS